MEEECRRDQLGYMVSPPLLGLWCRLDAPVAVAEQVLEGLDDHLALELRAGRAVAEARGALWAVDEQQIREPSCGHAEVGAYSGGPLVSQQRAVGAPDVDRGQPAADRVEPGGEHDD